MYNDYFVIDSHCHIYPEKIAAKAVEATDKFYGVSSDNLGTTSHLIETYKKVGIDHAVVQSVATTPKQVKSINKFIADAVNNSLGFFTGLGTLHPDCEDFNEETDYIVDLGLKGVKLHPDIQNFKMDTARLFEMYEICEKKGLVMLIHTGDKRYDNSNPDRVLNVLKSFPDLTVIGAHFGGWSVWEEAAEKLCGFKNFYVDCSSSFQFAENADFKKIIMKYGTDKVLFASDYPMWDAKDELETLFSFGFSKEDMTRMLSVNAKKIFNI